MDKSEDEVYDENPFAELEAALNARFIERDDTSAYNLYLQERARAIQAIQNGELIIQVEDRYALGDIMFEVEAIDRVIKALAFAEMIDESYLYDNSQPNPYYRFITKTEAEKLPEGTKTYEGIIQFLMSFISKYPKPQISKLGEQNEKSDGKFAEGKALAATDYLDIPYRHDSFIPKLRPVTGLQLFETIHIDEIANMLDLLHDTLLYRTEDGEYKNTDNDVIFILQTGSNDHKRFSNLDLIDTTNFIQDIDSNKIVVIVSDSEVVDKDIPATDMLLTEHGFQITRGDDFEEFFKALNRKGQKRIFLSSKDFNITAALVGTKFQTITTDSLLEWVSLAVKTGIISTRDLEPSELVVLNTLYGDEWHVVDKTQKGAIHIDSEFITNVKPIGKMKEREAAYKKYFGTEGIARQDMARLFETLRKVLIMQEN